MTAKIYKLNDYVGKWSIAMSFEDNVAKSIATIFTNDITGELEISQTNDCGEEIKTRLNAHDVISFYETLKRNFHFEKCN